MIAASQINNNFVLKVFFLLFFGELQLLPLFFVAILWQRQLFGARTCIEDKIVVRKHESAFGAEAILMQVLSFLSLV
jgi:hypothetical protein